MSKISRRLQLEKEGLFHVQGCFHRCVSEVSVDI